jgi:hypothetical protein
VLDVAFGIPYESGPEGASKNADGLSEHSNMTSRQGRWRSGMLLLAGWYLMLVPKSDAPQSLPIPWSAIQKSFDTARECERARPKDSLQGASKFSVQGPATFALPATTRD